MRRLPRPLELVPRQRTLSVLVARQEGLGKVVAPFKGHPPLRRPEVVLQREPVRVGVRADVQPS